jgi:hypothetical protein
MARLIAFILGNFTLTFFVIGLIAAAAMLLRRPHPLSRGEILEEVLAWFLFFSIGVSFFYNFFFHVFFGAQAAAFIGWEDSPFQAEVGYASLGFSAVGFLAFRGAWQTRLAAILGPALFLWGAAIGHALDMIRSHNFAPGNAGVIFWTDTAADLRARTRRRGARPSAGGCAGGGPLTALSLPPAVCYQGSGGPDAAPARRRKLEDERPGGLAGGAGRARRRPSRARLRRAGLPARNADHAACGRAVPGRRPGLPLGGRGRAHRRHRRRDAGRRRRGRGDPRPFGAAR